MPGKAKPDVFSPKNELLLAHYLCLVEEMLEDMQPSYSTSSWRVQESDAPVTAEKTVGLVYMLRHDEFEEMLKTQSKSWFNRQTRTARATAFDWLVRQRWGEVVAPRTQAYALAFSSNKESKCAPGYNFWNNSWSLFYEDNHSAPTVYIISTLYHNVYVVLTVLCNTCI